VSENKQQLLQEALAAAQLLVDMPALADPLALTAEETSLSNAFVCQPQQRNMHGRIFGGFLMRYEFTPAEVAEAMIALVASQFECYLLQQHTTHDAAC
jgi:acyl-coenzyme A thioesterase 9